MVAQKKYGIIPLWEEEQGEFVPDPMENGKKSVFLLTLHKEKNYDKIEMQEKRPAVIICPGGGYETLSFIGEGISMAEKFEASGYFPFILRYRVSPVHYPDISLSCRNFLNESCYRAAALIKNMVPCLGKVEMMSCFGSTDLLCDFYDSSGSIFGGYGLITRDGIRKPAFYALQFLQNMGKFLIARGENYFITSDERNDLYLIIFNCCRMDTIFYQEQKEDIGPEKVDRLFEKERINIQILLRSMKKGRYIIKKSSLGPEQGSLLDAWKKLGYKKNLDREEIRYLTSMCIPHLEYDDYEVRTGAMTVNTSLQTNEIQLYQIRRERE